MKVLYASHTGLLGGGERSLLDLIDGLPSGVEPRVACPEGPLAEELRQRSVSVLETPGTEGSLRLHPWHTAKALAELWLAGRAVRRHAHAAGAEIVHANSIRAGLTVAGAARRGDPPLLVHVRDCLPDSRITRRIRRTIGAKATIIVANSRHTASRFALDDHQSKIRVIYSPVDLARFDLARVNRARARRDLGLAPETPALGMLAQLTPWKGQDTAIRALAQIRQELPGAVLLLAGEAKFTAAATRHDNRSYIESLHRLAAELGVRDAVRFLGERDDAPAILRALDLLLVPSHEEPFGRSVVESMAIGTPVLATAVGGPAEVITDGQDGRLLPPDRYEAWAEAAITLLANPEERARLGEAARRTAARFSVEAHVEGILAAYNEALSLAW